MSLRQGLLPFKIELVDTPDKVTAHAGLPLALEALRSQFRNKDYRRLRDALGYRSWKTVRRHLESLVLLVIAGGESLSDLETLRADHGLVLLLDFEPSGTTQAKDFLYRFHQAEDGHRLSPEEDAELSQKGKATIRPEGPGLLALAAMVDKVVQRGQLLNPHKRATLDVDATIVEAYKELALKAYEGTVGYQPQMAWWAELGMWISDQFRDGNVNAEFKIKDFLEQVCSRLPGSVTELRLRGDSALYNEEALTWAADVKKIQFAISADMSPELLACTQAIPEEQWKEYRTIKGNPKDEQRAAKEERQWAEVPDFVPGWARNRKKSGEAFRYIAIRVRPRQRDLLEENEKRWRHFAVVTNMDWSGERLLRWHREKQGTVEHGHGVVKNDLGGGRLPCGRFGANAAWWRINVLAHDLLQLMKVRALPDELASLRLKALRFRLFNVAGRVVQSGRETWLRLWSEHPAARIVVEARRALLSMASGGPIQPQAAT
jgi:hypothetical protein